MNHPLPVEQVVSGHHAQEARWIGDRVKLVVELLKLLVQQISCLALCLAAWAPSEREMEKEWETCTAAEVSWQERGTLGKVDNTQTYIVSQRVSQLHTLLISPQNTLFYPQTLGLISQAWSNTLMVSRDKSFHYNASDADPVSGESTTPNPQLLPLNHHPPISPFMLQPLLWCTHIV